MTTTIQAGWDDAPHLSEEEKDRLKGAIPPYQLQARTKGVPMLGAGAIYPMDEDDIICDPFEIPAHWPKGYGLDVGWNWTAAVWGARDLSSDTIYLWSEYKRGHAEPAVHIAAIQSRGDWMPGEIDPAAAGSSQKDGEKLMDSYKKFLFVNAADNAVEAGIYDVWERLSQGRLRVFSHLVGWLEEFRLYRRDLKGAVVKENDHLMDATRYRVMGANRMATEPSMNRTRYLGSSKTPGRN